MDGRRGKQDACRRIVSYFILLHNYDIFNRRLRRYQRNEQIRKDILHRGDDWRRNSVCSWHQYPDQFAANFRSRRQESAGQIGPFKQNLQ